MSRETKFRAWYKADLELGAPIKFTMDTKDDEIKFIATDEGFSFSYPFALVFTDDDFIIEQYTGLKDKNGKEIYIGDLFKIKYDYNWKKEDYFEVVFSRKLGIILRNSKGRWFRLVDIIKHYEIVGNIHENEELLK